MRRRLSDPTKLTASACLAPAGTALETLVQEAGTRWAVEACCEDAKSEVGLDHAEVRSWTGWYRHLTLAWLAHAFLTGMCAQANQTQAQKGGLSFQATPTGSLATFKAPRGLSSP